MFQQTRINPIDKTPVNDDRNILKTGSISPNFCISLSTRKFQGENNLWHLGMAPKHFPKNHYVRYQGNLIDKKH